MPTRVFECARGELEHEWEADKLHGCGFYRRNRDLRTRQTRGTIACFIHGGDSKVSGGPHLAAYAKWMVLGPSIQCGERFSGPYLDSAAAQISEARPKSRAASHGV